jgi:hypothetical protein
VHHAGLCVCVRVCVCGSVPMSPVSRSRNCRSKYRINSLSLLLLPSLYLSLVCVFARALSLSFSVFLPACFSLSPAPSLPPALPLLPLSLSRSLALSLSRSLALSLSRSLALSRARAISLSCIRKRHGAREGVERNSC